jgi:hypothetical protein
MKTWLKALIIIITIAVLFFVITIILAITTPFVDYNDNFEYSSKYYFLCKLQSMNIRHHCELPCPEPSPFLLEGCFNSCETRMDKESCRNECQEHFESKKKDPGLCETMSVVGQKGPMECSPDMQGYVYSQCYHPPLL